VTYLRRVCYADIETSRWLQSQQEKVKPIEFRFLSFLDENNQFVSEFFSPREFGRFLLTNYFKRRKGKTVIYFHNLKFDLKFLLASFLEFPDFEVITPLFRESAVLSLKIGKKRKKKVKGVEVETIEYMIEIRDSLALIPQSIEKLGNDLGLPKLEYKMKDLQDDIKYCRRDVLILKKAVEQFSSSLNISIDRLQVTAGATARRIFKRNQYRRAGIPENPKTSEEKRQVRIMKKKVDLMFFPRSLLKYENRLRKFYHGGYVEVLNFTPRLAHCYDFKSLYPSVMVENPFPIGDVTTDKRVNPYSIESFVGCECVVRVPSDEMLPLLPVVTPHTPAVFFPCGTFKTFLFREEIEATWKREYEIKPLLNYYTEGWDYPFDYLKRIYELKESGVMSYPYKITLNSTYGKDGEKREREELLIVEKLSDVTLFAMKGYKCYFDDFLNAIVCKKSRTDYSGDRNILRAMRVTALARLKELRAVWREEKKNNTPSYCDTDSLYLNSKIPSNNKLGGLAFEKSGILVPLGLKEYYLLNNSLRLKGVHEFKLKDEREGKTDWKTPTLKQLVEFYKKKVGLKVVRPSGVKESIARRIPVNSSVLVEKYKRKNYYKRLVQPDLTTVPLRYEKINKQLIERVEQNNTNYIVKVLEWLIDEKS